MLYDAELKFRLPSDWKGRLAALGAAEVPKRNASEMGRIAVADFLRRKRGKHRKAAASPV
jgi:predicted transcriptional regulator